MSIAAQLRSCLTTTAILLCTGAAYAGDAEPPVLATFSKLIPWGLDDVGQGDVPSVANPVTITRVSLGARHGAVRYSNGTIAMWGDNDHGQTTAPTVGAGITFTQVEAGGEHTIALLSDGSVIAWGYNIVGQTDVPDFGGSAASSIAAGTNFNLAHLVSGVVIGWGDSAFGQTVPPIGLASTVALAAGRDHSAALSALGEITCWGSNADGQTDVPALDPGETFASVQCGNDFTVALTSAGNVKVWGNSAYTTIPATVNTIVEAGGHFENAYLRTTSGVVKVWGNNANGQNTPASLDGYMPIQVAVGSRFLVVAADVDCDGDGVTDRDEILGDSALDCDENGKLDSCEISDDNSLDCNENGQLDRCELVGDTVHDCNGNGKFDTCELDAEEAVDCDGDGTIDSCQIAEDAGLDCNDDGELDSCSPTSTGVASNTVNTINAGTVITASGTDKAPAAADVKVTVTAKADLGSFGEWFTLTLNDTIISYVFVSGGENCPEKAQVETVLINAELWNSLTEDGDVELKLTASPYVSSAECAGSSAKLEATWQGVFADCNNNGTPDLCDLRDGIVSDVDGNGIPDTCENFPRGDINRDRKSDVLYYNSTRREFEAHRVNYNSVDGVGLDPAITGYPRPDATYSPIGMGDFDGDGYADLVFRKSDSRGIQIRLMQDDTTIESGLPGTVVSRRVDLVAVADIDGNGTSDLIWQHSYSKEVFAWLMSGVYKTEEIQLGTATGKTFVGAGDIDADGDADLIFRTNSTNTVQAWIVEDNEVTSTDDIVDGIVMASVWEPRGMGDINGDGKSDIIWRNRNTGQLNGWILDGGTLDSEGQIGTTTFPTYDVVGIADYNGDGRSDLALWLKGNSPELKLQMLNGLDIDEGAVFVPTKSFKLVKP